VNAPRAPAAEPQVPAGTDSQQPPAASSAKVALFDEVELRARSFWTVPETAFICRVGPRTVWRLMADPKSGFPAPRRVRGRTLLARDEVLAFLQEDTTR
jgi:hypothetical protein